jgi:hypothetical protein
LPVIMLEEFYVKGENRARMQELREKRNELFKQVKSLKSIKTYQQLYGGVGDSFIEFLEFDDLKSLDDFGREASSVKGCPELFAEMRNYIEPGSLTRRFWRQV